MGSKITRSLSLHSKQKNKASKLAHGCFPVVDGCEFDNYSDISQIPWILGNGIFSKFFPPFKIILEEVSSHGILMCYFKTLSQESLSSVMLLGPYFRRKNIFKATLNVNWERLSCQARNVKPVYRSPEEGSSWLWNWSWKMHELSSQKMHKYHSKGLLINNISTCIFQVLLNIVTN